MIFNNLDSKSKVGSFPYRRVNMKTVTYDFARENFEEVINMTDIHDDGIVIVKNKRKYVLMDKNILDSATETLELLKDSEFLSSLKHGKEEIDRGESFTFEECLR